jgi:prevent-host-death family protein
MASWQVQDAKARFSEFLEASLRDGPQTVTRRGVETAVLVPYAYWKRLQETRPTLKSLLLAAEPRFDPSAEGKPVYRRRPPVRFS